VRTARPSGVRFEPVQSDAACTESGEIVRRGFASGGAAEALSSVETIVPSLARHTEDGSGGRGRRHDGRQTVNIARKLMEGLTAEFAVGPVVALGHHGTLGLVAPDEAVDAEVSGQGA
jgi:hypothetical protein